MVSILLLSTFSCVIGSENVTDINKIYKKNVSLNSSVVNSHNTINMSVIYVDQGRGNDAYPGTVDSPKRSIKSALNAVKENGTINVASGLYSGTENTNLFINKSINITGYNPSTTIIDGYGNSIYTVLGSKTVFIMNFTFRNGRSDYGGAINNLGNLNISRSIFENNAGSIGGAIYNKNNLDINKCIFTNNHANQGNGLGGAIYTRQGTCTICGTGFYSNNAIGDGGAINNNYGGNLILISDNFNANTARTAGALSNGHNCDINTCTFSQNTADRMGGAIYSMGNLNVDKTDFTENKALFDVGGAIGTALVDSTPIITINNTNFNKNRAKNCGAISNLVKLDISNSKFNENRANEDSGAIGNGGPLNYPSTGTLTVKNTEFTQNNADNNGGGIVSARGFIEIFNSSFINNHAFNTGGAILIRSSNIIDGNSFTNNSASQGGAIYNGFVGDASYPSSKINHNNFLKNTAKNFGGAILNVGSGVFSKNNFTWNKVLNDLGSGGAIFNDNGTIYLDNNNFAINYISTKESSGDPDGGGIANFENGHIYISGSKTHFMDSNIYNEAFLDITDCTIEKNTDDDRYLNNNDAKQFKESNIKITNSSHTYDTPGSDSHFDIPAAVEIKKGESTEIKAELWRHDDAIFFEIDNSMDGCTLTFKIYDINGNYYNSSSLTNLIGNAYNTISTENLSPGNYRLQIASDGGKHDKSGAKCDPCVKTIDFTVLSD
jgi:predicted outer membrane repeat protein